MRRILRRGAEGALDHRGHLIVVDRPRSARTGLIQQAFDTIRHKAPTPLSDRVLVEPEFIGDAVTRQAIRTSKDDTAAFRQRPRNPVAANLAFKIGPLVRAQDQGGDRAPHSVRHNLAPTSPESEPL